MAFSLPTFRQILTRVQSDLGQFSDGTVPRRTIEYFLAFAVAGVSRGLYGFQSWIHKQAYPDTAEETNFWHWFTQVHGLERNEAVAWEGIYIFTGVDGTDIPHETQVQRADGELYETDGLVTIGDDVSGQAAAVLRAVNAGAAGNCEDLQELSLALPLTDVDPTGTVEFTTTTGNDIETIDDAKARLLTYLRTPPRGGGPGDYVVWALEVSGITRAWEFANRSGPNSVDVAAVRDNDGTGAAIVPDSGERATLLAHLESKAPITVTVNVIALTAVPLDVTLSSLTPDNATVRAAIVESLTDLLEREAAPGVTIPRSRIDAAISDATGETAHVMTVPAGDVTYADDEIGVMGTLT